MLIARYAPGLGDPWLLTHGQWVLALIRIEEILREERPSADSTEAVQEKLELMQRRGRRERIVENARSQRG